MSTGGKYKGVRYIAKSLTKYFHSSYPKYSDALPKAREIFTELKKNKKPVKLGNIFPFARKKRTGKKQSPEIDSKLSALSYYFELVTYPIYILRNTNEVWFISKISPQGLPAIQGGTMPEYEEYFAPFVNYANGMAKQTNPDEKRYDSEWNITCTPAVFNPSKKRWESKIISVDGTGTPMDYGFDPKRPAKIAKAPVLSETEVSVPEPAEQVGKAKETTKPGVSDIEVRKIEAQTEQERQKNIANALKLYGEGMLTKMEFKEIMAQIKK